MKRNSQSAKSNGECRVIESPSIWDGLRKEYQDSYFSHVHLYSQFINELNIGIEYLIRGTHEYKVTDENKWVLAKIKYGFVENKSTYESTYVLAKSC
jgi:hypothetical protein